MGLIRLVVNAVVLAWLLFIIGLMVVLVLLGVDLVINLML